MSFFTSSKSCIEKKIYLIKWIKQLEMLWFFTGETTLKDTSVEIWKHSVQGILGDKAFFYVIFHQMTTVTLTIDLSQPDFYLGFTTPVHYTCEAGWKQTGWSLAEIRLFEMSPTIVE